MVPGRTRTGSSGRDEVILVCSSTFEHRHERPNRRQLGLNHQSPPVLSGPHTSGSDEPNWKHVLHTGSPSDRWDNITLLTRDGEREGAEVEETRKGKPSRLWRTCQPERARAVDLTQQPAAHPPPGLSLGEQAALQPTGGNPEQDTLGKPLSLGFHRLCCCRSRRAEAAGPVVKVRLICTKLPRGPEARYPAGTGNPEHAQIMVV